MLININPQGGQRDHEKPMPRDSMQWNAYFNRELLDKGKKAKSPTNELTEAIKIYVKLIGGDAFRINTTGIYNENMGMYIHSGSDKGVSDLLCCISGKFIAIEIKVGKDSQRPKQIKFQQRVEKSGGKYFIAKDFDSAKTFIDSIAKP